MTDSPEPSKLESAKTPDALDQLALQIRHTLKSADPDQVHDFRVATRRFGQALAVMDDSAPHIEKIRGLLKRPMKFAGAVRDCDIALKLIRKMNAPLTLQAKLKRRRADAERPLIELLRDWTDRGVLGKWRSQIPEGKTSPRAGRGALREAIHRLFKRGEKADGPPRALHKIRIAAKKLRYTMELTAADPARVERIKQLQSKLGDINDHESARRLVRELGASQRLTDLLKEKQDKKIRQFRRAWKEEFEGTEHEWQGALARPPGQIRKKPTAARSRSQSVATAAVRERPKSA